MAFSFQIVRLLKKRKYISSRPCDTEQQCKCSMVEFDYLHDPDLLFVLIGINVNGYKFGMKDKRND